LLFETKNYTQPKKHQTKVKIYNYQEPVQFGYYLLAICALKYFVARGDKTEDKTGYWIKLQWF
jgi:hypothetical protein